jgi:Leucine-rich repeat (LRR) protein
VPKKYFVLSWVLFASAAISYAQQPRESTERDVAEWVIRQGGRVVLADQTQPLSHLALLPPASEPVFLDVVDLYGTLIEPKELVQLSKLSRIRELYLPGPSWNPGAGSRLDANEELRFLSSLQTLEKLHFSLHFLTNVNVKDSGLKHLQTLGNLKELRLSQGRIQNFSLEPFTQLESLDLSYSTATDEVLKGLAGLGKLRRLNLRDTLITNDGLAYLGNLATLEEIDLYGLKISDRGVEHLRNLTRLRKLNLLGGTITDAGAEILSGLKELRELNLYRAEITNAGLARIAALRHLSFLDVRYTRATASGVAQLRAALPNCRVDFSGGPALAATAGRAPQQGAGTAEVQRWIVGGLGGKIEWHPDGKRVRAVSLARTPVTDAQLPAIASLDGLEDLDLEATEIGDVGLEVLTNRVLGLRRLNLGSTTVSDRALPFLAKLAKLEDLNLSGTLIRTPALGTLPGTLRKLDLSSSGITSTALQGIQPLTSLEKLNLAYTDASDESALKSLASLPKLSSLDLTGGDTPDAALEILATFPNLEELLINHGRFTVKGLASLTRLTKLRRLEAVRTALGADAGPVLARFPGLRQLNLDYTTVNDSAIQAIAAAAPPLEELRLDSANITDAAVDALAAMRHLRHLNLYHTLVSEPAYERLRKALPQTTIIWDRDSKLPNRRGS